MHYSIKELCEIIGVSDTLIRSYLGKEIFEKKRVPDTGRKLIYNFTNSDIKLLKQLIDTRVRWYRKARENNVECKR